MLINLNYNYRDTLSDHNKTFDHTQADSNQLYDKLKEGLNDIALGNTRPFAEAMADVKVKRSK